MTITALNPNLSKIANRVADTPADQIEARIRLHLSIHHNLTPLRRAHASAFRRYEIREARAERALRDATAVPARQGTADLAVAAANRAWDNEVMPAVNAIRDAEDAIERDLRSVLRSLTN